MLLADQKTAAFVQQQIRTRDDALAVVDPRCTLLLHLANIATSAQDNLAMHRRVAQALERSNVQQVILPQSFSTLGELRGPEVDPLEVNFGFRLTMNDPYPQGKLAAEKFWLEWQSQRSDRRLLLVYVPIILGPHSAWTTDVAHFAPDQVLLVPKIQRFFGVREQDLVAVFKGWFAAGLNAGVERRFAVTIRASLRDVIAMDRAGSVKEVNLPASCRPICSLAERKRLVNRALCAQLGVVKKMLRAVSAKNIVPLDPAYLRLFLRQEANADALTIAFSRFPPNVGSQENCGISR
jgi:nucleoside-diphosphate-sugar epimerase